MWRLLLCGALVGVLGLLTACGDIPTTGLTGGKGLAIVTGDPLISRMSPAVILIEGRVKNDAARPYSGIVTVTLFDAGGKIVGTATGGINDVPAGDEVTYQASGMVAADVTWTRLEAKITTQIAR